MSFTSHAGPSKPTYELSHTEYARGRSHDRYGGSNRDSWSPETSPTSSDTSSTSTPSSPSDEVEVEGDMDSNFLSSSPPSGPSLSITQPTPSPSSRLPKPLLPSPSPSIHPYRPSRQSRPSGLNPLSSLATSPKLNLPKSQPLSRALFARMVSSENIPGCAGIRPGAKQGAGGKQKLIVATKPMRTTFELGLTASELARRA